jgi:hypothetical protein
MEPQRFFLDDVINIIGNGYKIINFLIVSICQKKTLNGNSKFSRWKCFVKNPYYRHPKLIDKPIVIYGAGDREQQCFLKLRKLGVRPVAFCDRRKITQAHKYCGLTVYAPEEVIENFGANGTKFVVGSWIYFNEISQYLLGNGIDKSNIISMMIEEYCDTGEFLKLLEVDGVMLYRLQNVLLDGLSFIHTVCSENDIYYSLFGGILLGSVRHGGFIPWDDDIDVVMFCDDYEKLSKILSEMNHEKYYLSRPEDDDNISVTRLSVTCLIRSLPKK